MIDGRQKDECKSNRFTAHRVVAFLVLASVIAFYFLESDLAHATETTYRQPQQHSTAQYVLFSNKHQSERRLVMKQEHITLSQLQDGRICIALVDLNNDGRKEILSYIDIFDYCGQREGCPFNVYTVESGKLISLLAPQFVQGFPMFITIDGSGKQKNIGILPSNTMGWQDILIDGETVWKWNGRHYKKK
jgi:hypothetical protein